MAQDTFVIVGAGLAGAKAAEALRRRGFEGRIVLIGDEAHAPYERPALSKGYLNGTESREALLVHPDGWYAEHQVELLLDTAATALDPAAHTVTLTDGTQLGWTKLLLATGAAPRRLPVPGADLDNVLYLRRVDDSDRLKDTFRTASRIVLVGGGWIGLETAAAARRAGVEVTVLEAESLPLLRVLGPTIAPVFADLHREHGVDLRLSARATEIVGDGARKAAGVQLTDGTLVETDAVVVGVGAVPNTALAEDAGLRVDNGIVTDAALRTSHPDICAAGDVANALHPRLGRHLRVEHWANALNQPDVAAASMLGQDAVYDRLPYFFTDQYDLGMEYAGHAEPGAYDDVIVRGDLSGREFIAFWLADGRVLAGMNVNTWDVNNSIQELIRSQKPVDPIALADPDTPLDQLLPH
jgi:3-phenylpropionate/trans-cinnamate dioxygenase ferredoxin reductase subunit